MPFTPVVAFSRSSIMPAMLQASGSRAVAAVVIAMAVLPGLPACRSTAAERRQLASDNPLDEAEAAVRLAEAGETSAIHRLVYLLEDDNEGVRMFAFLALQRLCGQTYGYSYYAPEPQRSAAVARWQEALRRGELVLRPPVSARTGGSANVSSRPAPATLPASQPALSGRGP